MKLATTAKKPEKTLNNPDIKLEDMAEKMLYEIGKSIPGKYGSA